MLLPVVRTVVAYRLHLLYQLAPAAWLQSELAKAGTEIRSMRRGFT